MTRLVCTLRTWPISWRYFWYLTWVQEAMQTTFDWMKNGINMEHYFWTAIKREKEIKKKQTNKKQQRNKKKMGFKMCMLRFALIFVVCSVVAARKADDVATLRKHFLRNLEIIKGTVRIIFNEIHKSFYYYYYYFYFFLFFYEIWNSLNVRLKILLRNWEIINSAVK